MQFPAAANDIDIERLAGVSKPGIDLLRDLIEIVQSEPTLSTAGLIERFRSDQEGQHLGTLATVELPQADEFDPAAELADCVIQLAHSSRKERIDILIEKQRLGTLSASERDELSIADPGVRNGRLRPGYL